MSTRDTKKKLMKRLHSINVNQCYFIISRSRERQAAHR